MINKMGYIEIHPVDPELAVPHEVQLVNYLVATKKDVGLLLNFGPNGIEVKRKFRKPKKTL